MVFSLRGYVYYLLGKLIAEGCHKGEGAGFGVQAPNEVTSSCVAE